MKRTMLASALLLVAAVASAQDDKSKKEMDKFQGTWKVQSGEKGGKPPPAEILEKLRFTFAGDKLTVVEGNKDKAETATYTLDPSKNPAQIDVSLSKGGKEMVVKGIYKFDGKKLTICWPNPGAERPTEFSGKDQGNVMMVLVPER